MYKVRVETIGTSVVKVIFEDVEVEFEADTIEEAKKDANKFVVDLLKDTWRISI